MRLTDEEKVELPEDDAPRDDDAPRAPRCVHPSWHRSRYCGVQICEKCGYHKGLARCFCGWAASGGNGRAELEEMGETIDPDY